jgi:hypothetical protein
MALRFPLSGFSRGMLVLGVILLTIVLRVTVESSRSLSRGEEAEEAGDLDSAAFHFRAAAQWYAPGAPWPRKALVNLQEMALVAEKSCETCARPCDAQGVEGCRTPECSACEFAVHLHDSVRAGILGSRSFYTPHADLLAKTNARFPGVLARAREVHPNGPRSSVSEREEWTARFSERMEIDHAPDPLLASVSSLAFLAWILAMMVALWRGWSEHGQLQTSPLIRWGAVSLASFLTWISTLVAMG